MPAVTALLHSMEAPVGAGGVVLGQAAKFGFHQYKCVIGDKGQVSSYLSP